MRRKAFTAFDGLLAALLAVGVWALPGWRQAGTPSAVEIIAETGTRTVPLGAERQVEVTGPLGTTVIQVGPDGARVLSSPCPLQLCVRSGEAVRPDQVVACLPNRVAIRLVGPPAEGARVDAVGR